MFGKTHGCSIAKTAVRAFLVISVSPLCDFGFGIGQVVEPVSDQALISEAPVETFDMPVLHRFAGLDVNQVDLLISRPSEDWRLVSSGPLSQRTLRLASLLDELVQGTSDASAIQAGVDIQSWALARESIDRG